MALQVQGRQDLQGKIKALAAALGFGYGLTALLLGAPPLAVAAFKLIETLANLAGGLWLILSNKQFRPQMPPMGRIWRTLRLGGTFALIEVTASIYNRANLFFLQRYGGADAVAQYSVAWGLVDAICSLVSGLLLQSILYPLFVQLWGTDRNQVPRLAQNTARWLLAVALMVMFFLFFESDRLVTLVFGPRYQEAIWLQKVLVFTVAFAFLHNLAATLMISMQLPRLASRLLPGWPGHQSPLVLSSHPPEPVIGLGPGHGGHQGRGCGSHRGLLPVAHGPAPERILAAPGPGRLSRDSPLSIRSRPAAPGSWPKPWP